MKPLIVLGITGSIASVRSFDLTRELQKKGFQVQIVMSEAAKKIVTEDSMEWGSGKTVITKLTGKTEHVKFLGENGKASLLLIAPATANTISKIAMGIDDTPITTFASVAIGSGKPVLIAPAMHEPMYKHPIVQKNLGLLKKEKMIRIIAPFVEDEKAKMENVEKIILEVQKELGKKKLKGKKVLIGNGATYSQIDPMRIITNLSSGKTGREIAKNAIMNGASVSLIDGTEQGKFASSIMKELGNNYDYFILPAAINDFQATESKNKISSGEQLQIELTPTKKLLGEVREKFPKLKIIGFKAETNKTKKQLEQIGKEFLTKNKLQIVVVNDIAKNPPGKDFSEMLIVSKKKTVSVKGSKEKIAERIISEIAKI